MTVLPECPSHPELIAQGWVRRFMVGPDRQAEVTELYESLGNEVRLESVRPDSFDERCGDCPAAVCRSHLLLYTRPSQG
ncbi:MAG: hypothetical protein OEV00_03385 [Acidobacteriota bacterium]|nr:hypothetical protein [Acidobacteriota bacterium]MDH3784353.1 hypothetical protein [Acidobacteriota bacterium]